MLCGKRNIARWVPDIEPGLNEERKLLWLLGQLSDFKARIDIASSCVIDGHI
jgi:hypothetical protein